MGTCLNDLMAAANAAVPAIDAAEAQRMMAAGGVLVLDVRDMMEVQASGKVAGAVHVPRGLLEFQADAESPMHNPAFSTDKTVILYCGSGGRAALAGKTLKDFGYDAVYNLGGFQAWAEAGGATEPA